MGSLFAQSPQLVIQKSHSGPITYMKYNQYNKLLYSFSQEDKTIKIWNPVYGKLIKEIDISFAKGVYTTAILLPHGKSIMVRDDNNITLLSEKGELINVVKKNPDANYYTDKFTGNILIVYKDFRIDLLNTQLGIIHKIEPTKTDSMEFFSGFKSRFFHINSNGILTYIKNEKIGYSVNLETGNVVDSIFLPNPIWMHRSNPKNWLYTNEDNSKYLLMNDDSILIYDKLLKTKLSAEDIKSSIIHYCWDENIWISPDLDKIIIDNRDTLYFFKTITQELEKKIPFKLKGFSDYSDSYEDLFIVKNQNDDIFPSCIFDWKTNKLIWKPSFLSFNTDYKPWFIISKEQSKIFYSLNDTLLCESIEPNYNKITKIYMQGVCGISTTDNLGNIFIASKRRNQGNQEQYYIKVLNADLLKVVNKFPDFNTNSLYNCINQFSIDTNLSLLLSGYNINTKRISNNSALVNVYNDNYNNAFLLNDNLILIQKSENLYPYENDTSKISLQLIDLNSEKLISKITSPYYPWGGFSDAIMYNGKIFLTSDFINFPICIWDTSKSNLDTLELPVDCWPPLRFDKLNNGIQVTYGIDGESFFRLDSSSLKNKFKLLDYKDQSSAVNIGFNIFAKVNKITDYKDDVSRYKNKIVLSNLKSKEILQKIDFYSDDGTNNLLFSHNGRYLVFYSYNFGIILWKRYANVFKPIFSDTVSTFGRNFTEATFNNNSSQLYYVTSNKKLVTVNLDNDIVLSSTLNLNETPKSIMSNGSSLAVLENNNIVQVFKQTNNEPNLVYTFYNFGNKNWLVLLPNGYYFKSREIKNDIGFVRWPNYFSIDQFDLKYNRPDIVLKKMGGSDSALIKSYHNAYVKRVNRIGIDALNFTNETLLPVLDIPNRNKINYFQTTDSITIELSAIDSVYKIKSFNVWDNDVPLYSMRGIDLNNKKNFDTVLSIKLSDSINKIEASVINNAGTESYKLPLFVNYTPIKPSKPSNTYFVGIGVDHFYDSTYNLKWCTKDIKDLAITLNKKYNVKIIDTLFNENVTNEKIKNIKKHILNTSVNDKIIIAYSGHGLLSNNFDYYLSTYNVNFNKPEENGLSYENLESLLDSVPARNKLLLIDACHSGEVDKEDLVQMEIVQNKLDSNYKGAIKLTVNKNKKMSSKSSFELMKEMFMNLSRGTGANVISAASGTQFALERNELKNGVFTYSILEYLKNNTECNVLDLKEYVNQRVTELTEGMQVPTSRSENLLSNWKF